MRKFGLVLLSLVLIMTATKAQKKTLDKIVAVIGSSIVLQSDVEMKYQTQYLGQGNPPDPSVKCLIARNFITQKLLAQQAVIDSIDVKDDEVDGDIDRRMRGMIQRA